MCVGGASPEVSMVCRDDGMNKMVSTAKTESC